MAARLRCSAAGIARPGCRPFAQGRTKLTLLDTEPCNRCDGNGLDWGVGPEKCRRCGGTGRTCVRCNAKGKLEGPSGGWIECDVCDGYGWGEPLRALPVGTPHSDVWLVKGGKPYSVQKPLANVLKTLRGDVCVCDPYFGPGVLDALVALKDCDSVRCLTREFGNGGKPVAEEQIKIFRKDHPAAEFRVSNSGDLRDRYVLAETRLLLLGHGLRDFGNKESFVIVLDEEFTPIKTVKDAFETHWEAAQPLG